MNTLGLKLWSTNTDYYFNEAKRLYKENIFDYIELYIVPNSLNTIQKWKKLEIPFALHAPHFLHEVNLSKKEKESYNIKIFDQVHTFYEELKAHYIVAHGGMNTSPNNEEEKKETIRQFKNIISKNPYTYLIENKPYQIVSPKGEIFYSRGANFEEIENIIQECNCKFCLDVGHAICTANSLKIEPYSYIKKFNSLNPYAYHISDNDITSIDDKHKHIGDGTIDFKKIFAILDKNKDVAVETDKNLKHNLFDFEKDIECLRKMQ